MTSNAQSNKKINVIVMLNIIGTLIYQGINFLLTPILTRALGTYDYGVVSLYTTWVNFVFPIVGLSTSVVIPHIKMYIPKEKQNSYLSSLAGLSALSYLAFTCVLMIFLAPVSKLLQFEPIVLIMLALQAFGMTMVKFIVAYYIQYQKTISQFIFTIGVSIATCFATILLLKVIVQPEYKYLCRVIGFAIPYLLAGLLALVLLLYKGRKLISTEVWKFALPICVPIIFHSVSHIILGQSDKVMLQMMLPNGTEQAGLFGFAYTIATIGTVMWTALNNAWVPFYNTMLGNEQYALLKTKSSNYMFLYTTCFCGFYLVIPEFSRIMGGRDFSHSINIIPVIYLSVYFVFLYSFAVNYKTIKRKVLSIAIGTISATICNLVLNYLLIPRWEMMGAAITSLISYILLFLFHHVSIAKEDQGYCYNMRFYGKGLLAVLTCTVIFYLFIDWWMIRWGLAAILGVILLMKTIKQKSIF